MPLKYFPPIEKADAQGLVAISEGYSLELLLEAYRHGIFPWPYAKDAPIGWFCPPQRGVLFFDELHLPRSYLRWQKHAQQSLDVTFNQCFTQVMEHCAKVPRKNQHDTWITPAMISAYEELFDQGYGLSCEIWDKNKLVAGLYGVLIDGIFSGESMFTSIDNGSKFALVQTVRYLKAQGLTFMDTQMITPVIAAFGGREISRQKYLHYVHQAQLEFFWSE